MSNILEAIINISNLQSYDIDEIYIGNNRVNTMGAALEKFVCDSFANSFNLEGEERNNKVASVFSYLGAQNYPPDMMLTGGDAIEVKKLESPGQTLQLNSSHPKHKLRSASNLIAPECVECEEWDERDLVYAVGYIKSRKLNTLCFVYGDIYAAKESTYLVLKEKIQNDIKAIADVDFSETTELGRVNDVDPLKITDLRVRGMWLLQNPNKVFNYIFDHDDTAGFQMWTLMRTEKFQSFPADSINKIHRSVNIETKDVQVRNPNNLAELINCVLITYRVRN